MVGLPDGPQELVPPVPLFILHFYLFVVDSVCIYADVCILFLLLPLISVVFKRCFFSI